MNSTVMQNLERAYQLHMQGQLKEAEHIYRGVLETQADNVHALNLLGMLLVNTQRAEEAVLVIKKALLQNTNDPQSHSNLGLAFKDLQQFESARKSFETSIRLDPRHPVVHNNLGNVLMALQEHQQAVAVYRQALKLKGDYVECLSNLASALKETRQYDGAHAALDYALKLRPQFAEAHNNRGEVLFKQARFAEAVTNYKRALEHKPDYSAAMINLSAALKETGEIDAAKTLLEQLVEREPDNARAHNNLGILLEQVGEGDSAAAQFRQAIRLSPNYGNAYYQLAQLRGHGLSINEINTVHQLLKQNDLLDKQRTPLNFALACAYENSGDYDRSFQHLEAAQNQKAKSSPYDNDAVGKYYKQIAGSCSKIDSQELVDSSAIPVFVLGMPRSGTSLTEQILSSHPDVYGAGELSLMEDTLGEAKKLTNLPYPQCVAKLSKSDLNKLAQFYMSQLQAKATGEKFIVDKTPMNFQYIGFIANLLPQARFIHCRRDPVDNCLSIFKLPFEDAHSYSHSLESLGQYYRHYEQLTAHWTAVTGNRMINLQYEDVVGSLEDQARRLLDFLGLPFDDAVLNFHRSKRIVKTPSASQVRQPIYSGSVLKWKKYEQHLGPLLSSLKED